MKNTKIILSSLVLTLFFGNIAFAQFGDDRNPDPSPCTGCGERRANASAGIVINPWNGHFNPTFSFGFVQNRGDFSVLEDIKYASPLQKITDGSNTNIFGYHTIELPVVFLLNPTNFLSVGAGIQGNYLLNASENTKIIDFATDNRFNRLGAAWLLDAEIGAKNRGPRVGLRYTNYYGSGLKGNSYGTVEVTLRVQIGKKPQ